MVMLQKGMLPGDVRALLGEPKSVQPFRPSETQNEVWTYVRTVTSTTTTEATRTRQVPYFDPFLNAIRMIDEPDYQPLTIDVTETLSLLFIDGQLAEWKTRRDTERDYN